MAVPSSSLRRGSGAVVCKERSWSEWLDGAAKQLPVAAFDALEGVLGQYRFMTSCGPLVVREERALSHPGCTSGGSAPSWTRARCPSSGKEFDVCRLGAGSESGRGFVPLGLLQALDREAELAEELSRQAEHPHLLRCYGKLVENVGGFHYKMFLYDQFEENLVAHLAENEGVLEPEEVGEVGQQLGQGLAQLHRLGIFHGGPRPRAVVRGCDGQWKLCATGCSARLDPPLLAADWRRQVASEDKRDEVPPEARGDEDDESVVVAETDMWLLSHLLASLLFREGALHGETDGNTGIAAAPEELVDPIVANLWLLLHWLLAARPEDRPCAREAAMLLSTVRWAAAHDLLEGMPDEMRARCCHASVAAARQLAVDKAASASGAGSLEVARLAGMTLQELRKVLGSASAGRAVDRLCENCGIDLNGEMVLDNHASAPQEAAESLLSEDAAEKETSRRRGRPADGYHAAAAQTPHVYGKGLVDRLDGPGEKDALPRRPMNGKAAAAASMNPFDDESPFVLEETSSVHRRRDPAARRSEPELTAADLLS
eukprot:TRINITY_DN38405_c0_g1_i1.p1 TRINITY_DN38405_c0_g1~~TRINITY_DN38405_c0_g1_i1.p1  ORF type:complete len:544 (-),score=138.71 TRINITY_DN38405_c0_g1_i1:42-1673(-)